MPPILDFRVTNMFKVSCPHCNKMLNLHHRKQLILQSAINCIYCNRLVKVKEKSSYANSWFIGALLGISMSIFLEFDIQTIIVVTLVVVFIFQRFIDIFYSLESAEEDFYD